MSKKVDGDQVVLLATISNFQDNHMLLYIKNGLTKDLLLRISRNMSFAVKRAKINHANGKLNAH